MSRPDPVHIDDPDDSRIASYRCVREKDLSGREGLFVAEGKVVLSVLFAARRFEVESVLLLENRVAGMRETLAAMPEGTPVYVASQDIIDRIAGFHLHRGVLALGRRRTGERFSELVASLPEKALVVALVGISNHDNVGAIFRNAAAFGADAVILDETSCDPLYRKAIRVSVGAALKVPFVQGGAADAMIAALDEAGAGGLVDPREPEGRGGGLLAPRLALERPGAFLRGIGIEDRRRRYSRRGGEDEEQERAHAPILTGP